MSDEKILRELKENTRQLKKLVESGDQQIKILKEQIEMDKKIINYLAFQAQTQKPMLVRLNTISRQIQDMMNLESKQLMEESNGDNSNKGPRSD